MVWYKLSMRLAPPTARQVMRIVGVAWVVSGVLADAVAGWLCLGNMALWTWGLLVHVPAALLWTLGISILEGDGRPVAGGWTVASLLTGLLFFPGLGVVGCAAAFGLSSLSPIRARRRAATSPAEDLATDIPNMDASLAWPLDPLGAVEAQPLVDIVRDPSPARRRATIPVLRKRGDPSSVRLLRELLADQDPDVRGDAAVALFRLEETFAAAVREFEEALGCEADLAEACRRYAGSGLLDAVTARVYRQREQEALLRAVDAEPYRADLWLALATVQAELGDVDAALDAVEEAADLGAGDAYHLGMTIAAGAGRWDAALDLARRGVDAASGATSVDDEPIALLRWWLVTSDPSYGGAA